MMPIPKPKFQYQQPVTWSEVYYLTELGEYLSELEWVNSLLDCSNGMCYEVECSKCSNHCQMMSAVRIDEHYRGFVISRHFPDREDDVLLDPEWSYEIEVTSVERWCPDLIEIDLNSLETTIFDVAESDLRGVFLPNRREQEKTEGILRLPPGDIGGNIDYMPIALLLTMRLTHTPEEIKHSVESPHSYDPLAVFFENEDHASLSNLPEPNRSVS